MTSWVEALDTYEASLQHHQQLIDTDAVEGHDPWPPAALPVGAMPADLAERAGELLVRSNLLVDEMAAKLAGIPPRKVPRHPNYSTRAHARWSTSL